TGNATLTVNSVGTFAGAINGASTFSLTKAGSSTLNLSSGANTYTGPTNVTGGTLTITNAAALSSTPQVNLNTATAALSVSAVSFSTPGTLSIGGLGGTVYGHVTHNTGTIGAGTNG